MTQLEIILNQIHNLTTWQCKIVDLTFKGDFVIVVVLISHNSQLPFFLVEQNIDAFFMGIFNKVILHPCVSNYFHLFCIFTCIIPLTTCTGSMALKKYLIYCCYLFYSVLLMVYMKNCRGVNCMLDMSLIGRYTVFGTCEACKSDIQARTSRQKLSSPARYLLRKPETSLQAFALHCLYIELQTGRQDGWWLQGRGSHW